MTGRLTSWQDISWGLSFAALTPLVVGTQFLTVVPTHAEATFHAAKASTINNQDIYLEEWLSLQEEFWSNAWNEPYIHGSSVMSVDPIGDNLHGLWDVNVWLSNPALDYDDPELSEADILDQVVADGLLDVAYNEPIAWDSDTHIDPDDGLVTNVETTLFITAGTMHGATGYDVHGVGTILRVEADTSMGDTTTSFNYALVETTSTLNHAIQSAATYVDALVQEASGDTAPARLPACPVYCDHPCGVQSHDPSDGSSVDDGENGSLMSQECCNCFSERNQDLQACDSAWLNGLLACLGGVGGIGTGSAFGFCKATCIATLFGFPCAACLTIHLAVAATALATCLSLIGQSWEDCFDAAQVVFEGCKALNCD